MIDCHLLVLRQGVLFPEIYPDGWCFCKKSASILTELWEQQRSAKKLQTNGGPGGSAQSCAYQCYQSQLWSITVTTCHSNDLTSTQLHSVAILPLTSTGTGFQHNDGKEKQWWGLQGKANEEKSDQFSISFMWFNAKLKALWYQGTVMSSGV